jgi:hypothetical protein
MQTKIALVGGGGRLGDDLFAGTAAKRSGKRGEAGGGDRSVPGTGGDV